MPVTPAATSSESHQGHPTIKDRVTIYSEATILGGSTVIGEDSVIGANTWITSSVPPNTMVTFQEQQSYQSTKR